MYKGTMRQMSIGYQYSWSRWRNSYESSLRRTYALARPLLFVVVQVTDAIIIIHTPENWPNKIRMFCSFQNRIKKLFFTIFSSQIFLNITCRLMSKRMELVAKTFFTTGISITCRVKRTIWQSDGSARVIRDKSAKVPLVLLKSTELRWWKF